MKELGYLVEIRREIIARVEKGLYNPFLKVAMDIARVFGKIVEEVYEFIDD